MGRHSPVGLAIEQSVRIPGRRLPRHTKTGWTPRGAASRPTPPGGGTRPRLPRPGHWPQAARPVPCHRQRHRSRPLICVGPARPRSD